MKIPPGMLGMCAEGRRIEVYRGLFSTRITLYCANGVPVSYEDTYDVLRWHQRPLGLATLCLLSAFLGALLSKLI